MKHWIVLDKKEEFTDCIIYKIFNKVINNFVKDNTSTSEEGFRKRGYVVPSIHLSNDTRYNVGSPAWILHIIFQ